MKYARLVHLAIIATLLSGVAAAHASSATETPAGWYRDGQRLIAERRAQAGPIPPARNVILFLGDGMSLATVSAARILEGQLRGESGEENLLHFETFPHLALAKTYNTNQQTPDSAGTMTAIVTGVKTFAGGLAVDQLARRGDCASSHGRERVTLLDLASLAGMGTGVVTDTRITHATPAALFARVPERRWESDSGIPPAQRDSGCRDIARQLVEYDLGGGIDVVLGGGRRAFLPTGRHDPEYPEIRGHRQDGRDLIAAWQQRHTGGHYVWNQAQFDALGPVPGGPVLGLFEPSHMHYEMDREADAAGEPSLTEMTMRSIEWLSQHRNGFFLMVEGGRIDHAHHLNNAHRALTNTIEFARAVQAAHAMTDPADTLIIVTADHGHALSFGGYGERGNPITGLVVRPGDGPAEDRLMRDVEGRPLTVLSYHDGPGYRGGLRPDFRRVDPQDPDFLPESTVWLRSASHSGEDVPVYATGPGAAVLTGVIEQNVLFHAMLQAVPALERLADRLAGDDGLPGWQAAQRYEVSRCSAAQLLTIGEC
ncbi:MAG: alkaline phosphatase [Wenzhouxiangella sp.]|nr:MAG: alkaline phosphatase [Wenzhouxiangella sp.]